MTIKRVHFFSKGNEDGNYAAYLHSLISHLEDTEFESHEIEEGIEDHEKLVGVGQLIFVSWPIQKKVIDIINELKSSFYLLYDGSDGVPSGLFEYLENNELVLAPIDINRDSRFHLPLLRNKNLVGEDQERERLLNVGEKLNQMIQLSMSELKKVKKIHEQIVPMKNENIKGLQILSKFGAGERVGGEFFDIVKGDQEFILLLTNTTSYVASSVILSHFERLRLYDSYSRTKMENFLEQLSSELKDLELLDFSNPESLQMLLVKIDLNNMGAQGFHFGTSELVSTKAHVLPNNNIPIAKEFFDQAYFEFSLERGEKLVISSPGVKKNCSNIMDGKRYFEFVKEKLSLGARELLNEIYFQLKKDIDGDFLRFDASVIYIKVDENVIMEV